MTVIIVDDENLTLKMMTKTVGEVLPEAEIHPFQRVKAAIEFAESTDISIAFLDIQMRGMTGTELAEKLSMLQPHMSYLKRLRADLLAAAEKLGLNSLILSQRGKIGLNTDLIDCDYFDYLAGKPDAISAYQGVYMEQYSWAEVTNSALYWNSRNSELPI